MTVYYKLNGKIICLTEKATAVPREGDLIEIKGGFLMVKKVIWHLNERATEAEIRLEYY